MTTETRAGTRLAVAAVRAAAALTVVVAVVATFAGSIQPVNPFNFFGYFTIQSNLFAAVVLALAAVAGFAGRDSSRRLQLARGLATAYIAVVGIVYNTLLIGTAGGVAVPWANTLLHVVIPLYCVADWLLVGDRAPIRYRSLFVLAIYPLVWCGVVLIRGATDGWVPYPFLNPSNGYGVVFAYVVGIAVAFIAVGALTFAASRFRGVVAASSIRAAQV